MKYKKIILFISMLFTGIIFLVSCNNNVINIDINKEKIEEFNINNIKNYELFDKEFDINTDYEIILNQYKEILGNDIEIKEKLIIAL